jgi:tRNA1Val (adenine37-N6)-methyltransferase
VAIMLALQCPTCQVEGLEIQPQLQELAESNAKLSGVAVSFHQGDLRTYQSPQPYDLIVSNPPWQKEGSGRLSPSQAKNISRFEISATMEDVLACVRRNLAPKGDALLLYPEQRVDDLRKLAPKTFLDIISLLPTKGLEKHFICRLRHRG